MTCTLKQLSPCDGRAIYDMLQRIPADENGLTMRTEWITPRFMPGCSNPTEAQSKRDLKTAGECLRPPFGSMLTDVL